MPEGDKQSPQPADRRLCTEQIQPLTKSNVIPPEIGRHLEQKLNEPVYVLRDTTAGGLITMNSNAFLAVAFVSFALTLRADEKPARELAARVGLVVGDQLGGHERC